MKNNFNFWKIMLKELFYPNWMANNYVEISIQKA